MIAVYASIVKHPSLAVLHLPYSHLTTSRAPPSNTAAPTQPLENQCPTTILAVSVVCAHLVSECLDESSRDLAMNGFLRLGRPSFKPVGREFLPSSKFGGRLAIAPQAKSRDASSEDLTKILECLELVSPP